jgi:eukaryotic-like serine/threonine-protein kinase
MSEPARQPAVDVESDLSGRTLGDFKLLRRLGRGAMAEVYLAEQPKLRRQVALKVLKGTLAGDATYVARFQNEAMAAASLVHANIVQIFEVGQAEGIHYIAQEYVAGLNLREWIARHGTLDPKLAVAVMRQAAAALGKAAQAGIVHRDIKPENIMISSGGEVKVADFGLARITRDDDALALTQVGVTMGTPLYMSPEQVEGRTLDPRSDLYSFGVTCYHMLAGAPPFTGDTALAVAVQHLKNRARRLEEIRSDLPPGLCRIVHRMLEKDPKDRYATARDLLRDLRALPIAAGDDDETWSLAWDESGGTAVLRSTAGLQSATRQLDDVMKTTALVIGGRRRYYRRIVALAAAAFLVGAAAAAIRARSEPGLLAGAKAEGALEVPRQPSAQQQFVAAGLQLTDVEEWLKSVRQHYPDDKYFTARADQELARLYWKDNRLDEALGLFDQFAVRNEEDYRAFGLAGQTLVYTKLGELDRAARTMGQLMPLWKRLDGRMLLEMQYATAANRSVREILEKSPNAAPRTEVPRQGSAQSQLQFAMFQLGDKEREDALKSVATYYPQDVDYVDQAKRELARLYLQLKESAKALPLFVEAADRPGADAEARTFGLAGQAILALQGDDSSRARRVLDDLAPQVDEIDEGLARMLAAELPKHLTRLNLRTASTWKAWLQRQGEAKTS